MKTSRLLIITAAIVAIAAPSASASPAQDPSTARPHKAQAPTLANIAAHKEQLSTAQYAASNGTSAKATPLTDRTGTGDGFPLVFVLIGSVLAVGLATVVAKPVRSYAQNHRRPPAHVA